MRTICAFTGAWSSCTMSSARSSTSHWPAANAVGSGHSRHVGQRAQRRVHHHLAADLAQRGRREHAMADEVGHEARCRAVVQRVGVVPLVQPALVHHADDVADGEGLQLVVGDEQRGGAAPPSGCRAPRAPAARAGRRRGWRRARRAAAAAAAAPARAPAPRAAAGRPRARAACAARCPPGPTSSSTSATRAARSARGRLRAGRRRRCGRRPGAGTARSPGTPCRCAAPRAAGAPAGSRPPRRTRRISPALAGSRPATARSSVVLPQPEGPISTPMLAGAQAQRDLVHGRARPGRDSGRSAGDSSTCMSPILDAVQFSFALVQIKRGRGAAPARSHPCPCARLQGPSPAALAAPCCRAAACWPWSAPGCQWDAQSGRHPARDGRHGAARLHCAPACGCACAVGAGRGRGRHGHGGGGDAVRVPRPARLRVGAAAAAGDAGLRGGLRLHRLPAVQRPAADRAARRLRPGGPRCCPRCAACRARSWCSSSRCTPMCTCWRARRWPSAPRS